MEWFKAMFLEEIQAWGYVLLGLGALAGTFALIDVMERIWKAIVSLFTDRESH